MLVPFLRFKVHLERKDSPAAVEQLKAMMGCDDFAKEYLQVCPGSIWLSLMTLWIDMVYSGSWLLSL